MGIAFFFFFLARGKSDVQMRQLPFMVLSFKNRRRKYLYSDQWKFEL